jgi:hypothetical protein
VLSFTVYVSDTGTNAVHVTVTVPVEVKGGLVKGE